MTRKELDSLDVGDIVTHANGQGYVIIDMDTDGIPIAIDIMFVTNPSEWELFSKNDRKEKK